MKRAFIGNFLDKQKRPRHALANNSDVSKYILSQALLDLDGVPITGPDPTTDEMIARMMAAEINAAINREAKSARHWYTDAIANLLQLAGLMHPEILDDALAQVAGPVCIRSSADARTVLTAAMAITSQSVPVQENMRFALEQYRYFMRHGRFHPKGYGVKGSSIMHNLARFNSMLDVVGNDIGQLREFLHAKFTMREVKEAAAKFGINIAAKEMIDEVVYGSILFGPKIGSFFQNLNGRYDTLTIDLWFTRTWGRYTGTLLRDDVSATQVDRLITTLRADLLGLTQQMREEGVEFDIDVLEDAESEDLLDFCVKVKGFWERRRNGLVEANFPNANISSIKSSLGWPGAAESIIKSIAGTVDAPTSGGQRRWMRSVMRRCLQILSRNGISMTMADAQASLWFPEQALFSWLAGRKPGRLSISYDEAMESIARKEGFTDEQIRQALRAGLTTQRGGQHVPGASQPGERGAVQRHGGRVDQNGPIATGAEEPGRDRSVELTQDDEPEHAFAP